MLEDQVSVLQDLAVQQNTRINTLHAVACEQNEGLFSLVAAMRHLNEQINQEEHDN